MCRLTPFLTVSNTLQCDIFFFFFFFNVTSLLQLPRFQTDWRYIYLWVCVDHELTTPQFYIFCVTFTTYYHILQLFTFDHMKMKTFKWYPFRTLLYPSSSLTTSNLRPIKGMYHSLHHLRWLFSYILVFHLICLYPLKSIPNTISLKLASKINSEPVC